MKASTLTCVLLTAAAVGAIGWSASASGQSAPPASPRATVEFAPANVPAVTARIKPDKEDSESSRLRKEDYELGRQTEALAGEYGQAKAPAAKDELKTQLRETLDKQFSAHHRRRELELSKLEARVRELRDLLNKRNEQRQAIVDRRLEQLLRHAEGLGWDGPSGSGSRTVSLEPAAAANPYFLVPPSRP